MEHGKVIKLVCGVFLILVIAFQQSDACTGTWKIKDGRKELECQPHEGVFIEKIADGNNRTCLEATLLQKEHCDAYQECTIHEEDFETCHNYSISATCVLQRHPNSTGKTFVANPYAGYGRQSTDGHMMITLSTQRFHGEGDPHRALECKIKHDEYTFINMSVFDVHVSSKGEAKRVPGTYCLLHSGGRQECQRYNQQEHAILLRNETTTLFIQAAGENRFTHIFITMKALNRITLQPVTWDKKAQFECQLNDKTLSDFEKMVDSVNGTSRSETTTSRMMTSTNATKVPKEDESDVPVDVTQDHETSTESTKTSTNAHQFTQEDGSTVSVAASPDQNITGSKTNYLWPIVTVTVFVILILIIGIIFCYKRTYWPISVCKRHLETNLDENVNEPLNSCSDGLGDETL